MSSEVIPVGTRGHVHSVTIPHTSCAFQDLHAICAQTPCHAVNMDVSKYIKPEERALIVQNSNDPLRERIFMTKGPDHLIFHSADGNFFSVLQAHSMFLPSEAKGPIPDYHLVSQVATPGQPLPDPVKISFRNQISPPHVLDRHCVFEHLLSHIDCWRPLESEPRELFSSKNLGTLYGRVIEGTNANLLKECFLGLNDHFTRNSNDNSCIYNKKLNLVPEISDLLMLKNPDGNISMHRCMDGLVGCRQRKSDNGHTLIFVLNSDDFHKSQVSPNGLVQLFKMDYKKKAKCDNEKGKQRITFCNNAEEINNLGTQFKKQGVVHGQMRVQDILNALEYIFRHETLDNHGCGCFPMYTQIMGAHDDVVGGNV
jgi:hypothetical protein